jgi:hypothetical protein
MQLKYEEPQEQSRSGCVQYEILYHVQIDALAMQVIPRSNATQLSLTSIW